jgi:hypothetical protein
MDYYSKFPILLLSEKNLSLEAGSLLVFFIDPLIIKIFF